MSMGREMASSASRGSQGPHDAGRMRQSGGDIGDRARLTLVILATVVLLAAFGNWALTVGGLYTSVSGRTDFSSYYAAALALRENLHANIYSAVTMAQAGAQAHTLVNPPLPYTYPPLLAIALSPFTVLSFRTLSRLWMLGGDALWLFAVFVLANQAQYLLGDTLKRHPQAAPIGATSAQTGGATPGVAAPVARSGRASLRVDPTPLVALALAALVGLGATSGYLTINTGQVNLLVLAPLALIPTLSYGRHERWVGVMVALAALLKITPILLVAYLLLRRRWEAAVSALIAMAALSLLCVVIVGPGVFFSLIPSALKVGSYDATARYNQALLAPIGEVMGHTLTFRLGEYVVLGLLAVALGYVLWRAPYPGPAPAPSVARANPAAQAERRAHNEVETLAYGVALCAMLLLSPTVWAHHYIWLVPVAIPLLVLTGRQALAAQTRQQRRRALGLLALTTLATLALDARLPYLWDTGNPTTHKVIDGITVWPYALDMRPVAALALVAVSVMLLADYAAHVAHTAATNPTAPGLRSPSPHDTHGAPLANGSIVSAASPAPPESTAFTTAPASAAPTSSPGDSAPTTPTTPTTWAPVPASALPRIFRDDA